MLLWSKVVKKYQTQTVHNPNKVFLNTNSIETLFFFKFLRSFCTDFISRNRKSMMHSQFYRFIQIYIILVLTCFFVHTLFLNGRERERESNKNRDVWTCSRVCGLSISDNSFILNWMSNEVPSLQVNKRCKIKLFRFFFFWNIEVFMHI